MTLTVSPQIRMVALAGLLATVGLALGFMILGRSHAPSAPKAIKPLHPVKKHSSAMPAKPTKRAPSVKPATKPNVRPKPAAPAVATHGLPLVVAQALRNHRVVVVALYQARRDAGASELLRARLGTSVSAAAGVDQLALGEAAAGARAAGVGFVGLDVLNQAQAAPLTKLLGVLPDPAVLVYVRPDRLYVKLNGFADRASVEQAAANADQ